MQDTERLNLLEHYRWRLAPVGGGEWQVTGTFGFVRAATPRDAMDKALDLQAEWALCQS